MSARCSKTKMKQKSCHEKRGSKRAKKTESLNWLKIDAQIPYDLKRLIAEMAWSKSVVNTTGKHWEIALSKGRNPNSDAFADACS